MTKDKEGRRPLAGRARPRKVPAKSGPPKKLIAIIAVAAIVAAGLFVLLSMSQSGPAPAVGNLAVDSNTKGSPDAKVTIIEYSDYQCPFCKDFAQTSGRQIDSTYVSTGQVRMIYRNRAVIGPESVFAGQAALCAGDQERYWDYHDKLFASQAGENRGAFANANLKRFAAEIGLDTGAFNSCLDSGKYASQVRNETAESTQRKVTGTPTFFVNDQVIEGAQPFARFKTVIDSELRKTQ